MNKRAAIQLGAGLAVLGLLAGCAHKKAPPPPAKPSAATEQAISSAQNCINHAMSLGVSVSQAQQTLQQAKEAAKVPNNSKAQSLASQVCQETTSAENTYYLQKARQLDSEARNYANLNDNEQSQLQQGQTAIANDQGKTAYNILSALVSQLKAARTSYTVQRGDNLWDIAKKPSIYGNPYEWPLIYLYNADKINNPDLIYPNQQFNVMLNPLKSTWNDAAQYARTRGPWRHGQALSKDHAWVSSEESKINNNMNSSMGGGGR